MASKTQSRRGILHIDDPKIPIDQLVDVIENLEQFEITEKVDGSHLCIGMDEQGFYTSRTRKGGRHYHSSDSWETDFRSTGFRSAHAALEQAMDQLLLSVGDCVEIEVLFGEKPNAIPYFPNQIIFLRSISGNPPLELIASQLDGHHSVVKLTDVPVTSDGVSILREGQTHCWTFSHVQKYDIEVDHIKTLLSKLDRTSLSFRSDVKHIFLDNVVRHATSTIGPSQSKGGWIEGVVLRRDDELYKVIDQDIFTSVNRFNHKIRDSLTRKMPGPNSPDDYAGLLGNLLRSLAKSIGHSALGTNQAKRYMKQYSDNRAEALKLISDTVDFPPAQRAFRKYVKQYHSQLKKRLTSYKQERDALVLVDGIGREHKYDKEIDNRTLQVFAELFEKFSNWLYIIDNAETALDLIMILVGDKI